MIRFYHFPGDASDKVTKNSMGNMPVAWTTLCIRFYGAVTMNAGLTSTSLEHKNKQKNNLLSFAINFYVDFITRA